MKCTSFSAAKPRVKAQLGDFKVAVKSDEDVCLEAPCHSKIEGMSPTKRRDARESG